MRIRVLLAVAAFLLWSGVSPAFADLKLEFHNGLVSLDATNATARQILAEWARLGGTRIVNGERVPGVPLTLQLVQVPERQALEIILRSASGYMAAPRMVPAATTGASMFDRILVMPTSTAPPPSPVRPSPANAGFQGNPMYPQGNPGYPPGFGSPRPGMMRGQPQQPIAPIDEDEQAQEDEPADVPEDEMAPAPMQPVVMPGMVQPGMEGQVGPRPFMPAGGAPYTVPQASGPAIPMPATSPQAPGGSATTPGVIIQPAQPTPTTPRPPGR